MASDIDVFTNWKKWGAFRIPVVGIVVLTALLLVGSIANIEQANFVQKVTVWVLGSGVISYGHSLAHSTQQNWQGDDFKDLTKEAQAIAMGVHAVWFLLFAFAALKDTF